MRNNLLIFGAVTMLVIGALYFTWSTAYRVGTQDAVERFVNADKEGAEDVRKIAKEILSDAGVADPDELLRSTGGLRDAD